MILEFIERLSNLSYPLRPPGALPEDDFIDRCIRCRKCAEICPYDSIIMAHGHRGLKMGTPFIYPQKIPCYLCEDFPCIEVCPTDALQDVQDQRDVAMGLAVIDESLCLPFNGIICRACYERCPIYKEAITLKDQLYPVVQKEHCVGCGICEQVCPTNPKAITVVSAHK
ncbi:MAG: 4Fe-4S dicluster domain-containing protein [Caldithrix sp.]|nr:4Fe-4S dicluster domain-containing protein [Caldithrix sp.]